MQFHAVAHVTSATTSTLVAVPGAGYRIRILAFHVSEGSTAPGTVTLGFSATNQRVWDFLANQNAEAPICDWEGDTDTALSVTTAANGPTDVSVDYVIEAAP